MRQFEAEQILSKYKIHTYKDVKEACGVILGTFREHNGDITRIKEVIAIYGLDEKKRDEVTALRRHWLTWYIIKTDPTKTLSAVAKLFNRHHATAIHSRKKHCELIDTNDAMYSRIVREMEGLFI